MPDFAPSPLPPPPDADSPHEVEEDPEQHLGEVILDPWTDDAQTDWPNS